MNLRFPPSHRTIPPNDRSEYGLNDVCVAKQPNTGAIHVDNTHIDQTADQGKGEHREFWLLSQHQSIWMNLVVRLLVKSDLNNTDFFRYDFSFIRASAVDMELTHISGYGSSDFDVIGRTSQTDRSNAIWVMYPRSRINSVKFSR